MDVLSHLHLLLAGGCLLAAACGGGPTSVDTEAEPTPSTTLPPPATRSAPTSPEAPSTTASPTVPPVTSAPASTTPTTDAPLDVFEPAPLDVVGARPREEIPWNDVGEGWLLVTLAITTARPAGDEPAPPQTIGLYAVSPTDDVYGIVAWPHGPDLGGGLDLTGDWSALFSDAGGDPVLSLDLRTLATSPVALPDTTDEPGPRRAEVVRNARVSRDGTHLLVTQDVYAEQNGPATRWRLARVSLDGATATTLIDVPLVERALGSWHNLPSFVELESGGLVTAVLDQAWVRDPDGRPIGELQVPSTDCDIVSTWSDDRILLSCADPDRHENCWTRGLWLVPLDGSVPELLAVPDGEYSCYSSYTDAATIDGATLFERGHGEGECERSIELPDGSLWAPDDEVPCNANLLGVRGDAWIVRATSLRGEVGSQTEGPVVVYEIRTDGTRRLFPPDDAAEGVSVMGLRLLGG